MTREHPGLELTLRVVHFVCYGIVTIASVLAAVMSVWYLVHLQLADVLICSTILIVLGAVKTYCFDRR